MPPGFREDIPERVIEASTRADGSVRKPIRVRAGYVNQDEVQKYRPGAFRRLKQEAEAGGGLGPPATPEGRLADARVRGERGRDRPGPSPASRGGASSGEPPESASASKPAAAAEAAEPDAFEAEGEGGGGARRERRRVAVGRVERPGRRAGEGDGGWGREETKRETLFREKACVRCRVIYHDRLPYAHTRSSSFGERVSSSVRFIGESVLQSKVIFFALTDMSTSLKCAP